MGWRIVEIEKNCFIKLFLNNLIISGTHKISIPLKDIDVILFNNNRINISVSLLNELCEENICVIFCDSNHLPHSMLLPFVGNINTLKILEKQINWSIDLKEKMWQKIIKLKINSQIDHLFFLEKISDLDFQNLNKWKSEIIGFDETNREGHIAKLYWVNLLGQNFTRQNDNLIFNKVLNYGYTVLNAMIARSIVKKGLDCRISIFHKSVHNQFALSSDFIEPFRVVIDILLVELIKNNVIDIKDIFLLSDVKEIILDFIANFKLMINGLNQQLNNAIDEFIDFIISEKFDILEIKYDFKVKVEMESD